MPFSFVDLLYMFYCIRIRCDIIFTTIEGVLSKILKLSYMLAKFFFFDGLRQHFPVCYHFVTARNCGHPGTPVHGNINSYVFTYGSTVEYTCNKGYTLVGSKQRVCQANQTWSGTSPQCTSRFGSLIESSYVIIIIIIVIIINSISLYLVMGRIRP